MAPGQWFESDIRGGGTAAIVDLTGQGGNLENNQALPTGAVRLTTGADNADKAEIAVADDYGVVAQIFNSDLSIGYGFHKALVPGGNQFAAPSLKLAFQLLNEPSCGASGAVDDCFLQLVYEPTWNQPGLVGQSSTVPTDQWFDVTIDLLGGAFWSTGGFGSGNSAGGLPVRTLSEWQSVLNSNFDAASLVAVSVGVGAFNQDQEGYFDDVSIRTGDGAGNLALDTTFDFELQSSGGPPPSPAPAPATLGLLALGLAGLMARKRRRGG